MTQQEYIGFDTIDSLGSVLKQYTAKKIFLVADKESYEKCRAKEKLDSLLLDYKAEYFFDFESNPKIEDLNKGIELFEHLDCDVFIAVGGGSIIDMAKLINFFGSNKIEPKTYISHKVTDIKKPHPLVAIPTTSGTGSEATHFAVLYIENEKFSIEHDFILPDVAIVDPQFTLSLPAQITASTGMDAFCQAIESYWCVNSTAESKDYAKHALKLAVSNLQKVVNKPDKSSRLNMAHAANLAGKAINITKTTAPHAISYPITSYYGVPHGHAVALTLSSMLVYNSQVVDDDVLDTRGADYVRNTIDDICRMLGADKPLEAKENIDELMSDIGLETRLSRLVINSERDIEKIITNGFNPQRVKNNPRMLTENALRHILLNIQ